MLINRIEAELEWGDLVTVRLLRRWVAARDSDEHPLPGLIGLANELGLAAEGAVALGSVFQLTENCLGRRFRAECCCSPAIGADERAVLLMIALAQPKHPFASQAVPHGLPSALAWAIAIADGRSAGMSFIRANSGPSIARSTGVDPKRRIYSSRAMQRSSLPSSFDGYSPGAPGSGPLGRAEIRGRTWLASSG